MPRLALKGIGHCSERGSWMKMRTKTRKQSHPAFRLTDQQAKKIAIASEMHGGFGRPLPKPGVPLRVTRVLRASRDR